MGFVRIVGVRWKRNVFSRSKSRTNDVWDRREGPVYDSCLGNGNGFIAYSVVCFQGRTDVVLEYVAERVVLGATVWICKRFDKFLGALSEHLIACVAHVSGDFGGGDHIELSLFDGDCQGAFRSSSKNRVSHWCNICGSAEYLIGG